MVKSYSLLNSIELFHDFSVDVIALQLNSFPGNRETKTKCIAVARAKAAAVNAPTNWYAKKHYSLPLW